MERLTVNKNAHEMSMVELAHNSCFAKDRNATYRDFEGEVDARELTRKLLKQYTKGDDAFTCDDDFDEYILDCLQYGTDTIEGLIALFYRNLWAQADLYETLKHYEDAEEQSLLLKLLCKMGDIIYFPDKSSGYVFPITITQIIMSDLGEGKYCVQYNGCFFNGYGDAERDFEFETDDFGKNVFLTQSEAEEELKKMNGTEE